MTFVLLDTGPIIAMLNTSDRHHRRCVDRVNSLEGQLVTCEAVVGEACYLLRNIHGATKDILTNITRGEFCVPFRLADRAEQVSRLMTKYADLPMDLADACLVDLATELKSSRIFTLDSDFHTYRWGRNRPFDILLEI
jgi:predicted nucleic acid-binding protein